MSYLLQQDQKNYAAWSQRNVVQFYTGQRHTVEELYDSERALLVPALESCASVLDVGCAAGGFSQILQALKAGIRYVGVDVSADLIAAARRSYPTSRFEVSDGSVLAFPDQAFDLTLCTGVLLHNPNYQEMIRECYRVARRGCVIDVPRLVSVPYTFDLATSYMVLKRRFREGTDGLDERHTIVPYVLSHPQPLFDCLVNGLKPRPSVVAAVGYYGQTNESVTLPVKPVCFCVVYLAKVGEAVQETKLLLDLPEEIKSQIQVDHVQVLREGRAAISHLIRGA